jgi:hypothetical protein
MNAPKWIRFAAVPHEGKTKRWNVLTLKGVVIARIAWSSGWRRYVLQPGYPTEWEQDCLRDVAAFVEEETRAHRAAGGRP